MRAASTSFPFWWVDVVLPLAPGRVLVEYIETDRVPEHGWSRLALFLSEEERERARRFHFERDRQVYVAGHALMRDMLSRSTGRAPQDWQFSTGAHGKPEAIMAPDEPRLRINLSHTRGLAAVALTLEADIGVDVEWMARETSYLDLARRFFSEAEQHHLANTHAEAQRSVFFALWTLKEAYIKAIGLGLAMPLSDFAFDPAGPTISFADHVKDSPGNWSFRHHALPDAHVLSLAIRRLREREPDVTLASADLMHLLGP
jgi:4'-phosphopantetheinyl transferase